MALLFILIRVIRVRARVGPRVEPRARAPGRAVASISVAHYFTLINYSDGRMTVGRLHLYWDGLLRI